AGSLRKFGTDSKGISGTPCCANAAPDSSRHTTMRRIFIMASSFPAADKDVIVTASVSGCAGRNRERFAVPVARLQLDEVVARISKIDAAAAPVPVDDAFDADTERFKSRAPALEIRRPDPERYVERSLAVVGRNRAIRRHGRFSRRLLLEEK